jgi:hypothetical protein
MGRDFYFSALFVIFALLNPTHMKTLIQRLLFGPEPEGEKLDLTIGTPRIAKTAEPDETLGFNEFWTRVHAQAKADSGY